ncbi:MAG: hypothetical protein ACI93T_000689, partial [Porticoccaceae bacterium]
TCSSGWSIAFADFRVPANRSVSDRPGSSLRKLPGSAELRADTLL